MERNEIFKYDRISYHKAKKEYKCHSCCKKINIGERYHYHVNINSDYGFNTSKLCRYCSNLTELIFKHKDFKDYSLDFYNIDEVAFNLKIISINTNLDLFKCNILFGENWFESEDYDKKIFEFNRNENNDPFIVKGGSQ